MNLIKFSIEHKVLINLITLIAIITGLYVAINMKREAFPDIQVDWIYIRTVYPGASPKEVEKLVTIPMEDAIKDIDGIKTYTSTSAESISFIFIELEPDLSDRNRVINKISREADKVDIPNDTEDPFTDEFDIMAPLIELAFSAEDMPEMELREHVRNFEDVLKDIDGIGSIDRVGWRDKEIWIEVDPKNLDKYYLSLAQVIQSISNQDVSLPGGKLTPGTKEIILRTIGESEKVEDYKEIIVRSNSDGKHIKVSNLATISENLGEQTKIYKTNAKKSISLIPKKQKKGDIITLVDIIKVKVKEFKKSLPNNVSIDLINDFSFYVKRRLNALTSNGIMGLILLIFTLLLFLNIRVALVTALGIPFAFLTALLLMSFFDISLNLITMFGLIMVLGMIVDDAIVVSENSYRYMEHGMNPHDATIKGASEVIAPVTATILTTAAAFAPLMFISGIMGKFLRFFPIGVLFALAASLFEAVIILPSHLAEWIRPLKTREELGIAEKHTCEIKHQGKFAKFICFPLVMFSALKHYITSHERKGSEAKWFQKLLHTYTKALKFTIHNRYKFSILLVLILIGSIVFSATIMPFRLFPDMIEVFYVRIEKPEGTTLKQTDKSLSKIEKLLIQLPKEELDDLTTTVGFWGEIGGGPFDKHGEKYGQCVVYLTPEQERKRMAHEIIEELRTKIDKLELENIINLEFEKQQGGPPVGKPVSIEVKGSDYSTLNEIKDKIISFMKNVKGIEDIKHDYELDKEEIQIYINKLEAARLGLDVRTIAATVRFGFEGGIATTIRQGDEDVDVIVKLDEKSTNSIDTLKNLKIPNNQNRLISLEKVAIFKQTQGIKNFNHRDGKRVLTITANIDDKKITSVNANKIILKEFKNIPELYPGYIFKSGGEYEETNESMRSMARAFIVAFMLIYMILATQFKSFIQPFIIMTSVPFGIIGVIFALFIHGQPMSLMAIFGTIGLTGVVVNDALIFVNFINKRREHGMSTINAAIDAGRTRLRPILLTSLTTIVALLPLIYGIGGSEPFLVPSAIALAYGLMAATFLTLVIVPSIYIIVDDIKMFFWRRNNGKMQQEINIK
ncbi:efflux RND transporter permease subunit [bacterium]